MAAKKNLTLRLSVDRKSDSERVENEIGDSIRQATFAYYYFVSSLEPHTIYLKQMSSKLSRGGAKHDSGGRTPSDEVMNGAKRDPNHHLSRLMICRYDC